VRGQNTAQNLSVKRRHHQGLANPEHDEQATYHQFGHFLLSCQRSSGTAGEMGVIRDEIGKKIGKKRPHLTIRRLLERAAPAVQKIKPLFLMSPLSVAQFLAPGRIEFDLLVIDEASQVSPEDALGAVARARHIVVVGDDKQLPPTNFFRMLIQ
jgi:AAA domain